MTNITLRNENNSFNAIYNFTELLSDTFNDNSDILLWKVIYLLKKIFKIILKLLIEEKLLP